MNIIITPSTQSCSILTRYSLTSFRPYSSFQKIHSHKSIISSVYKRQFSNYHYRPSPFSIRFSTPPLDSNNKPATITTTRTFFSFFRKMTTAKEEPSADSTASNGKAQTISPTLKVPEGAEVATLGAGYVMITLSSSCFILFLLNWSNVLTSCKTFWLLFIFRCFWGKYYTTHYRHADF